jgi:autotransporter-associated beta strand protein
MQSTQQRLRVLTAGCAIALAATTPSALAAVFFHDTFSSGSTLTNPAPTAPTATSASYQLSSSKNWVPAPALSAGGLKFGIGSTTGGGIEVQARFSTNALSLVQVGDYIHLTVTFTNTAGIQTANCLLGFGLYNSSGVDPVAGGLYATALNSVSDKATGGVQNWKGYWGQRGFTGQNSRILNRAEQTAGPDNRNQNLTSTGSGTQSYGNPGAATVGAQSTGPSGALTAGGVYTVVLSVELTGPKALAITNTYYAGPDPSGTPVCQFGGVTTSTTFVTDSFDSIGIGWRAMAASTGGTVMDISSITVDGSVTVISAPPDIVTQPMPVTAPTGASCAFSVVAQGYGMTYQWRRYGTNLINGGNISGATSDTLILSPVSAADAASGGNGYFVTVTGTGNYSTNSAVASLTLGSASALTWSGTGSVWDLGTSPSWLKGGSPATFNYGDSVTFNDTGAASLDVDLSGSYLSASSVTVNASAGVNYIFKGTGSFAGPGSLSYIGEGLLTLNNANAHTGGTVISNASAFLVLNNYNGLGSGPVTLAKAGGNLEIVPVGSASSGIKGGVVVRDDFNIFYDADSAFGAVLLGDLSGSAGKTLTFTLNNGGAIGPSRIRLYGTNTVCDANIAVPDYRSLLSTYQGSGSQTYNGVISGNGSFMQKASTTTYLNGANTYAGGTYPAQGTIGLGRNSVDDPVTSGPLGTGPILLAPDSTTATTGSGTLIASGGARSIANPIQYPSATNNQTLIIGGTNALTFTGAITLQGNDFGTSVYTNRIFQINNTALTTFAGVISDAGMGFGLIKTGTGILALNNTESYGGSTTVSNGTLQVNGQVGPGAVLVATNAILGGTGTINAPVTVQAGGTLSPGTSIGTLTINNNLAFAGNLLVEVNKSASPSSDKVDVSGTLVNTGTGIITVTNLGGALAVNDSFALFNKAVSGGNSLSITGGGAVWTNRLAVNGTIAVVTPISSTPTNINYSVSGSTLTLSWPLDHLTWTLQSNAVGVASSAAWFPVPGSQTTTQVVIPINPALSSVFYRLVK